MFLFCCRTMRALSEKCPVCQSANILTTLCQWLTRITFPDPGRLPLTVPRLVTTMGWLLVAGEPARWSNPEHKYSTKCQSPGESLSYMTIEQKRIYIFWRAKVQPRIMQRNLKKWQERCKCVAFLSYIHQ